MFQSMEESSSNIASEDRLVSTNSEANFSRVLALLNSASDVLNNHQTEDAASFFPDESVFDFEPTPINHKRFHTSQGTAHEAESVFSALLNCDDDSFCCAGRPEKRQRLVCSPEQDHSRIQQHKQQGANLFSMDGSPTTLSITSLVSRPPRTASPADSSSYAESTINRFRHYQSDQWMERFQDLIDFKEGYQHCLVPHNYPPNQQLAQWVKRQRYQYKLKVMGRHSTLTDDRQQELENMGFIWDSHKAAWFEKLESLKEFQKAQGHCNVPSNYHADRSLAIWVKCQRRQFKLFHRGVKSTMNQERYLALQQLGFDWDPRHLTTSSA